MSARGEDWLDQPRESLNRGANDRTTFEPTRAKSKPPRVVAIALGANLLIGVAKFVTAIISGSAAMFAEGVHSAVDTLNQGVFLYGLRRGERAADREHPFGYGKEVYFWSLIYSVLLFGVGGGVSVYKGFQALRHPEPPGALLSNCVVLAVALIAEGTSWLVALRAVQRERPERGVVRKLRRTTDPSRFVVLGEDSAALLGVVVAFVGVVSSEVMGASWPDAVASMVIGLTLCAAALILTAKTKHLLVGQAASPDIVQEVRQIAQAQSGIVHVGAPLTMHIGPRRLLAALDVMFDDTLSSADVANAVDEMECAIRERFPEITRIYIEAQLANADIQREQPVS